jgi:pimeloyl-ACP methyl ester carboxylesterase
MRNIQFQSEDGIFLRGWFYTPIHIPAPVIVMTPGFSALKEHFLAPFAEYFREIGFNVLLYDNRNFGESEGYPRLEVDPLLQIQDLQMAMTFLSSQKEVDAQKIFLWGTSFSAGNVIHVAAKDARVRAVSLQVPFLMVSSKENRPDMIAALQKKYMLDKKARENGASPMMTRVVTQHPKKSAIMKEKEAYDFFTSVSQWENQVTLRSIENFRNYFPMHVVDKITAPALYIVANHDTICPPDIAIDAYQKTSAPKKLVMIEGHHFSPYQAQFKMCANAAGEWFLSHR